MILGDGSFFDSLRRGSNRFGELMRGIKDILPDRVLPDRVATPMAMAKGGLVKKAAKKAAKKPAKKVAKKAKKAKGKK